MDFNYSSEQLALQDTLQRFVTREYSFERRRELAKSELGFSAEAWAQYAELGFLALPFPLQFDGLGGNAVDVMLTMEWVGRGLLLEPYLSTVVICGAAIRDSAGDEMKNTLLPPLCRGELKFSLACYEAASRYDLSRVDCRAVPHEGGWLLSGQKTVVLDAPSADHFLVTARAADGVSLFLVARESAGLSLFAYPTQSGARAADVQFDAVSLGPNALIGNAGEGLSIAERAVDRGVAALCAEASGIVTALNEATLSYLKSRKQFGVPIGKFQALQHRMADMFIAQEQVRSMAINAAVYADSADPAERRRAVSGAKAYIGQYARMVGQQAVQLHGAMGVVDEFIVSHYFKRLTMIDLTLGDTDFHFARFSDFLSMRS